MDALDTRLLAFIGISALLIVIPGPDTALVTRNALRSGAPAAALTALGVGIGSAAWAMASVLGLAILLESSLVAFTAFKLAGAVYLCFLGLRGLVPSFGSRRDPGARGSACTAPVAGRAALAQGLLSNLLNPNHIRHRAAAVPEPRRPAPATGGDAAGLRIDPACLARLLRPGGEPMRAGGRAGIRVRLALDRITGAILIALGIRLAFERR